MAAQASLVIVLAVVSSYSGLWFLLLSLAQDPDSHLCVTYQFFGQLFVLYDSFVS